MAAFHMPSTSTSPVSSSRLPRCRARCGVVVDLCAGGQNLAVDGEFPLQAVAGKGTVVFQPFSAAIYGVMPLVTAAWVVFTGGSVLRKISLSLASSMSTLMPAMGLNGARDSALEELVAHRHGCPVEARTGAAGIGRASLAAGVKVDIAVGPFTQCHVFVLEADNLGCDGQHGALGAGAAAGAADIGKALAGVILAAHAEVTVAGSAVDAAVAVLVTADVDTVLAAVGQGFSAGRMPLGSIAAFGVDLLMHGLTPLVHQ